MIKVITGNEAAAYGYYYLVPLLSVLTQLPPSLESRNKSQSSMLKDCLRENS